MTRPRGSRLLCARLLYAGLLCAGPLLGVAGCRGQGEDAANDPEEACRQQAYDDPDVKDAIMRSNTSLESVRVPALREEEALVRQVTRKCMAALGLAPPGGVEPVKQY